LEKKTYCKTVTSRWSEGKWASCSSSRLEASHGELTMMIYSKSSSQLMAAEEHKYGGDEE